MKPVREYLNMDETERRFLEAWDALPVEVIPLFEKMLSGDSAEFEQAERELRVYIEERRKTRDGKE